MQKTGTHDTYSNLPTVAGVTGKVGRVEFKTRIIFCKGK